MDVAEPNAVPDKPQYRSRLILHRCQRWTLRLLLLVAIAAAAYLAFGLGSGAVTPDQGVSSGVAVLLLLIGLCISFWLEERRMKATVIEVLDQRKRLTVSELIDQSNGVLERRSLRYVLAQMHREGAVDCLRERRPEGGSHRVFFRAVAFGQSSTKMTRKTILADPS